MKAIFYSVTLLICLLGLTTYSVQAEKMKEKGKIVIAHRGASGYLPEHTLPAKAMAYAQGADFLEQDVVMTKDDQLIVLHDHYLDRVTDVAQQFPHRARPDGRYYAIDFTLPEIRQLHFTEGFEVEKGVMVQTYPGRFPLGKADFHIHTLAEELQFIQGLNHSTGKNIGIYTEIKAPWFHRQAGKDITQAVLTVLKEYGYTHKQDNVYLQCFDADELKRIKTQLGPSMQMDLPLIQLIAYTDWHETYQQQADGRWQNYDYDWMLQPGAMQKIAQYADGIGPDYHMVIDGQASSKRHIVLTSIVKEAHQYGLVVHPYTVRADVLPVYVDNVDQLYLALYQQADVDGLFTDFTDKAVMFLQRLANHPA